MRAAQGGPVGGSSGRSAVCAAQAVLSAASGVALAGVGTAFAGVGSVLGAASYRVARMRGTKPLHPTGAVLRGTLRRTGASSGVAWIDEMGKDEVVVRLSRGGGLPPHLPDVHGIALRHDETDVLLSGTGRPPVLRHVLHPTRSPGRGACTTLVPFRGPRGPVLLAAFPAPARDLPADWDEVAALLAEDPFRLRLVWSDLWGPWLEFGELAVGGPLTDRTDEPLRFDPRRTPPGLQTYPWVDALRQPAYAAARRGRPTHPSDVHEETP